MKPRLRRGLTLAEIITVVAILLVLVAGAAMAIGPAIYKSKTQPVCSSNLKQIATAYVMYSTDNDGYPAIGGLVSHAYLSKQYRLAGSCPLNPDASYRDMFSLALDLGGLRTPSAPRKTDVFPNGSAIPRFDPVSDVLVRCLDHGFEGFDRHGSAIFSIDGHTIGRVLGARADTSVSKVAPLSCWEFGTWSATTIERYNWLWTSCDGGSK